MLLAQETYSATECLPRTEAFGLTSQMRRSAVSIPSNIAEGQGRGTDAAFRIFLRQARGSLFELETQAELAGSLGYLSPEVSARLVQQCEEVARMLNGLLNTLAQTISR